MAHPVYKVNGVKVPSVTTILSRFKESGALMYWAWDQGRQGLDYRETRDKAASSGTLAHNMVESTIRGTPMPDARQYPEDVWMKACSSFKAFEEWTEQTQLKPLETEVSLTCECHMLGGTLDSMLIQNKLALADWKTSNGVYIDYLLQIAAYGHLWNVNRAITPITGGYHLLRFSKTEGDFTHHYWADLRKAWRMFECLREAYDLDKDLKERL